MDVTRRGIATAGCSFFNTIDITLTARRAEQKSEESSKMIDITFTNNHRYAKPSK